MQRLELLRRSLDVLNEEIIPVVIQLPELPQEAVHTVDTLGIPRLGLLHRAEEHLVKSQCISTIAVADIVRIDHIVHRLAHLLDSISADILPVLEDELGISELRTPFPERLNVKAVILHNIYVNVDFSRLILVLQTG